MVSLGEKIAIIFPPVFFVFIVFLKYNESIARMHKITVYLRGENITQDFNFSDIVIKSLFKEIYIEYLIVSIINGIHSILILNTNEIGVIIMALGIGLSIFGLSCLDIEHEFRGVLKGVTQSQRIVKLCIATSIGYVGYIATFDIEIMFFGFSILKYLAFILMTIISYQLYPYTRKLLPFHNIRTSIDSKLRESEKE